MECDDGVGYCLPEPERLWLWDVGGRVTVAHWPVNIMLEDWFIEYAEPARVFWKRPGVLTIAVDNGEADYWVGDMDMRWLAYPGRLAAVRA